LTETEIEIGTGIVAETEKETGNGNIETACGLDAHRLLRRARSGILGTGSTCPAIEYDIFDERALVSVFTRFFMDQIYNSSLCSLVHYSPSPSLIIIPCAPRCGFSFGSI